MKKLWNVALGTLILCSGYSATAMAEISNCTSITSAPYTISAPGIYCLKSNITFTAMSGNAITVNASNVTLDLNGFQIRGPHFGGAIAASNATGVYGFGMSNVSIRNGRISGLDIAIQSGGAGGNGNLVENVQVDDNAGSVAIAVGSNTVVRNNILTRLNPNLTGNTYSWTYGISAYGDGIQISNNTITGLQTGSLSTFYSHGILVNGSNNALVEGNYIEGTNNLVDRGVMLLSCNDSLVVNNRISRTNYGVIFAGSTGSYSGNMTAGVVKPYTGGTAQGLNF